MVNCLLIIGKQFLVEAHGRALQSQMERQVSGFCTRSHHGNLISIG